MPEGRALVVTSALFEPRGRSHFRIPSLVATPGGVVVAFANERMDGYEDGGDEVGIVLRRSEVAPTRSCSRTRRPLPSAPTPATPRPRCRNGAEWRFTSARTAGRRWGLGAILHPGPAAYSSLVATPGGDVLCAFEAGQHHPYERIALARVSAGELLRLAQ